MAQFIGIWKVDNTTFQNVDAFCKAAGNYIININYMYYDI